MKVGRRSWRRGTGIGEKEEWEEEEEACQWMHDKQHTGNARNSVREGKEAVLSSGDIGGEGVLTTRMGSRASKRCTRAMGMRKGA